MRIMHQLTNIEISRGIICPRKNELSDFFPQLGKRFDMIIRGEKLYERTLGSKQIWIGKTIMKQFNPNDVLKISKKGNVVIVE